jgi:SAM-dependent methyltransferase
MDNPWLHIPAADYEGHMSSPAIAQQQFLAGVFKKSLENYDSTSVALLGCATGNGLEHMNAEITRKVTAVDINPEYLQILRERYAGSVAGLEVVHADLETCVLENAAYTLIFAGLLFEYVRPGVLLPKIAGWLGAGGVLVVVLQLPAENLPHISESRFDSLRTLGSIMRLVTPQEFKGMAGEAGLRESEARIVTLESGKSFYIGTYSRA